MWRILTFQTNTLTKATLVISFFTIFSQISAVIRDKIFATYFGAGMDLDIYYSAFRIPDFIFLLVGTFGSTFILLPLFEKKKKYLKKYLSGVFTVFLSLLFVLSCFVFIALPFLSHIFFPSFYGQDYDTFLLTARLLLLSSIFMSTGRILMGVNQKENYFISTAVAGVVYNFFIIFSTILFHKFGPLAPAFGAVLGALGQTLMQIPALIKQKLWPLNISFLKKEEVLEIIRIGLPRTLALITFELVILFAITQANTFFVGAVAIFVFATNIYKAPLTLIAASFSLASFPKMVEFFQNGEKEEFNKYAGKSFSLTLFFSIPIMFFIMFFSKDIAGLLFGSVKFNLEKIFLTGRVISILSFSILFQALVTLLMRLFYSLSKSYIPLLSEIVFAFSFFSIYYLNFYLKLGFSQNIFGYQLLNLSIIFSISSLFSVMVLIFALKFQVKYFKLFKYIGLWKKIFISLISVLVSKIIYWKFAISNINSFWIFFQNLLIFGILFLFLFSIFSVLLKEREFLDFKNRIIKSIYKY